MAKWSHFNKTSVTFWLKFDNAIDGNSVSIWQARSLQDAVHRKEAFVQVSSSNFKQAAQVAADKRKAFQAPSNP